MSAGLAFDPAEFAAFKSGQGAAGLGAAPAPAAPAADAFDPAEFSAFKASRQGGDRQQPTRTVPNPMSTVGQAPSFDERFGSGPMASTLDTSTREGAALRRVADEELIGKPSATNTATAALFGAGQGASLNLAGNAAAGVATVLGNLDKIGLPNVPGYGDGKRTFAENYARFQDLQGAHQRQNPKTSAASELAGAVAATPLMPGLPIAEGANIATRAGLYGLTGAGYGGAAAAIGTHDPVKALEGAGYGAAGGAILGPVIEKVAPPVVAAASKALEPVLARFGRGAVAAADGFTPEARAALRAAGLDADNLPPQLAQHIEATFAAKGPTAAAAREAQAAEFGVPLSRGQATQDPRALAVEGRALAGQSGPRAQQIGEEFAARQADAVQGVRDRFLGMAAGDAPRIENPQAAYEAVADRARQAAQAEAERASVAQRGLDDALRAVRGRGDADALDGATIAAQGLRDAAAQGKAGYRAAYDDVGALPHVFDPGALDMLGSRVRSRLPADVVIDDRLTPAAHRALQDLDQVPDIFNLAPGQGPSLAQTEQLRRRLGSLYPSTAQNPTDRRALGVVMDGFDNHLNDAAAFGALNRPSAGPAPATDGFPGFSATPAAPEAVSAAGGAATRTAEPETLTRFLARSGGIPLDAEARAADLHRTYVPGQGTLARNDAPSWDQIRVRLAEEGFLPPGMDGAASARDVADWTRSAIQAERTGGRPTLRMGDEAQAGTRRAADAVSDQNAAHADLVDRQARRMAIDLEGYGIRSRDLDRTALNDAAEHMVLGRHTDPVDAYEAALTAREATSAGRAAEPGHDIPFDGATAQATSDALPIGDTAPLEAMQRARGLFRQYQTTFKPRGPGDTAGANLRRIVERDASPNEVAAMLFGSTTGRVSPGQVQTLARLREAVGADSEPWAAVQRGLIARHLGGEGQDLGRRLDYLLRGEGRNLATSFLSHEQRAGLGQLRAAVQQAENAGRPTPTWATDLERTGFDPNAVGRSLFGSSGTIGAKPGAAAEARAARAFLGADSQEWSGLRQAAVQRLIDPAMPATKMVASLRDFTEGAGKGVASTLFNAEELAHFRRLASALQATVRPDGTIKPGAAGEAGRKAVAKAMDLIAGAIAFKVGGIGAAAGTYGAKVGTRAVMGGVGAASARRSFEGGAPRLALPPPDYAVAAGSAAGRVLAPLGAGY